MIQVVTNVGPAVLCRPDDSRLASVWSERGGYEQWNDNPLMIVIGAQTDDAKCARLAARFSLDARVLIRFRNLHPICGVQAE